MFSGEGALGVCSPEPLVGALLITVLEVERELEGLLELTVGAGGSHLQIHREFSESAVVLSGGLGPLLAPT